MYYAEQGEDVFTKLYDKRSSGERQEEHDIFGEG